MFALDDRYLLYIAAFKEHVSVYPVTAGMVAEYGKVIAPYRAGKGTLRFPLNTGSLLVSLRSWPRCEFRSEAHMPCRAVQVAAGDRSVVKSSSPPRSLGASR